jgi:hypothetical protein
MIMRLCVIGFALVTVSVSAQELNEASGDLLWPVLGVVQTAANVKHNNVFSFGYERVVLEHWSVAATAQLSNGWLGTDFAGWIELRNHLTDPGLGGWYFGIAAVASDWILPSTSAGSYGFIQLGGGFVCGWQFLLPWGMDLDFRLAIAYPLYTSDAEYAGLISYDGIYIGYRF